MQNELEVLRKRKFSKIYIEERFDVANDSFFLKALAEVYKADEIDNSERVLELKKQIENKSYTVDINALSNKIIDHMS